MARTQALVETWRPHLSNFCALTGMTVVATTAAAEELHAFGNPRALCSRVQACAGEAARCREARLRAAMAVAGGRAVGWVQCPHGLSEFVFALPPQAGLEAVYLFGGRVLLEDRDGDAARAASDDEAAALGGPESDPRAGAPGARVDERLAAAVLPPDELQELLSELPVHSEATVCSAASMLRGVARTITGIAGQIRRAGAEAKRARTSAADWQRTAAKVLDFLPTEVGDYRSASLQLVRQDGVRIQLALKGRHEAGPPSAFLLRPVPHDPLIQQVVEQQRAVIIPDVAQEGHWAPIDETRDVRAWVGLPLVSSSENRVIAIITMDHEVAGQYTEALRPSLEAFAKRSLSLVAQAVRLHDSEKALRELTFVNEVIQETSGVADIDDLLEIITRRVARQLQCSHCTVFLPTVVGTHRMLQGKAAFGAEKRTLGRQFDLDDDETRGIAKSVFLSGAPRLVFDTSKEPDFEEARAPHDPREGRSMLVVPIRAGEKPVGIISTDHDSLWWFTANDLQVVEALGAQVGAAILRSQSLTLLRQIGQEILSLQDTRQILEKVIGGAIGLLQAQSGVIYLLSADGRSLHEGERGRFAPPGDVHPPPRLDLDAGVTRTVWRTSRPVFLPDTTREVPGLDVNPEVRTRYRAMAAVPISVGDRVIGVFFLNYEQPHEFTAIERNLLQTLASQAGLAIQNATLLEQRNESLARHEALQDVLRELAGQERTFASTMDEIGKRVIALFPSKRVTPTINRFDAENDTFLEPALAWGPLEQRLRAQPRPNGLGRHVVTHREPVYIRRTSDPPADHPAPRREAFDSQVVSLAAIPLLCEGRALGVLFVNSQDPIEFSPTERAELARFAQRAVMAIVLSRHQEASVMKQELDEQTRAREKALLSVFRGDASPLRGAGREKIPVADEPVLLVGRRWNSWYPSYFAVDGGAYAVVDPRSARVGDLRGAVIDPGFRALAVLRKHGVPVSALDSCVVTHNHPDHVGGLFEYLSARNTLNIPTRVFAAQSITPIVGDFAGMTTSIQDFDVAPVTLIEPFPPQHHRRLSAVPFATSHVGVGPNIAATRGVLLTAEELRNGSWIAQATAAIVGDTEYQRHRGQPGAAVFDGMRQVLLGDGTGSGGRPDLLRFVVLHIGSAQLKNSRGKHLYLDGLISLVKDIEHYRDTHAADDTKLPILISEWGLEHASEAQIRAALDTEPPPELCKAFSNGSLLWEVVRVVEAAVHPRTVTLLPADLGLWIGIMTGHVYTARGGVPPDEVLVKEASDGLTYE